MTNQEGKQGSRVELKIVEVSYAKLAQISFWEALRHLHNFKKIVLFMSKSYFSLLLVTTETRTFSQSKSPLSLHKKLVKSYTKSVFHNNVMNLG